MSDDAPKSNDQASAPAQNQEDGGNMPATFPYDDEEQLIRTREQDNLSRWVSQLPDPAPLTAEELEKQKERRALEKRGIMFLEQRRLGPHTWNDVRQLAQYRSLWKLNLWRMFPINDLPYEILVNIFNMAILSHSSKEVTKSRVIIGLVCKKWKEIVQESPTIWSIIEFKTRPPFEASLAALRRSKKAHLILLIDVRDSDWKKEGLERESFFSPEDMADLMSHIVPVFDRIFEFFILCDTWRVMLTALSKLRDIAAPILSRFELMRSGKAYVSFERNTMPPELLHPTTLFRGGAPRLRHVSLDGVHLDWENRPFANLDHLEMRKMALQVMPRPKTFRRLMVDSSGLQTLALENSGPQWTLEDMSDWTPVEFPCLENLTMGDFAVDYCVFLLRLFTAPNLRRLTLCLMEEDCSSLFTKLTGMFPQVTVLFLIDVEMRNNEIGQAFFASMPNLRYLKLMHMQDGIFDLLLRMIPIYAPKDGVAASDTEKWLGTDIAPICGRLETAELGKKIAYENYLKLYLGRAKMGAPLRRLLIPQAQFQELTTQQSNQLRNSGILSIVPLNSRPELDSRYGIGA